MAYRRIKVSVTQDINSQSLVIHTDDPSLPVCRITAEAMYLGQRGGVTSLEYGLRKYLQGLCITHGMLAESFDLTDVEKYLYPPQFMKQYGTVVSPPPMNPGRYILGEFPDTFLEQPVEPPFEVNMMECLVGWKGWKVPQDGLLHSPSYDTSWFPDVAFAAACRHGSFCTTVVCEHHTCGIYATDKIEGAKSYGTVKGQVYGWGRYVRGDSGWRSQYAYPKSFHLTSDQTELIEPLKKYHVEIFIDQPIRMYDPQEEGYGYGQADEDGDSGAASGSSAAEEGSCGADSYGDEED